MARTAYVYFAQVAPRTYKIGSTVDLDKRMRRLQRGKKYTIKVVATITSDMKRYTLIEEEIHRELAAWRIVGEWFVLHRPVIDHIVKKYQMAQP